MSPVVMVTIIMLSFFGLLVLGFPVAFTLMGVSTIFMVLFIGPEVLYSVYTKTWGILIQDVMLAIPLFVFMATVFQYSGIGVRLYDMLYKWFAGLRGGLGIGTVALCTFISAITGLAATGIVTVGYLAFPEMEKRGYSRSISLGVIPTASALGPIIPPSAFMIIVGLFGQLSIGKLFMGGVFPGLLMSFLMMVYIVIRCWLKPALAPSIPLEERATWREKMVSLRGTILPLLLIVLVLGTIYTGVATPTEAGGVGALGALICAAVYRQLNLENLKQAGIAAFKINAMVMWIIIGGTIFGALFTMTGIANFLKEFMINLPLSPAGVMFLMMIITLIMGMFVDSMVMTIILIPVFIPVCWALGIDTIWFGILFSINIVLGMVTPPFGLNLFYTKGILGGNVTTMEIYRAVIPFVLIMIGVLFLAVIFPPLATWLPSRMK